MNFRRAVPADRSARGSVGLALMPARATFVAVRVGRAFLFSMTDAPCLHAKPRCMIAQRLWRVTIIVRR